MLPMWSLLEVVVLFLMQKYIEEKARFESLILFL